MSVFLILSGIIAATLVVLFWLLYTIKKEKRLHEEEQVQVVDPADLAPYVPATKQEPLPVVADPEMVLVTQAPIVGVVESSLTPAVSGVDTEEVSRLKEEVKTIREKAVVQARNALEVINKLQQENESFRLEANASTGALMRGEQEQIMNHLKAENTAFKAQIENKTKEVAALNEKIIAVSRDFEERMGWAKEALARLEAEKTDLSNQKNVDSEKDQLIKQRNQELASLREDILLLKQKNESILSERRDPSSLQEVQARDQEEKLSREEIEFLQYELTKCRAQILGLERVCENVRRQLEGSSRLKHEVVAERV